MNQNQKPEHPLSRYAKGLLAFHGEIAITFLAAISVTSFLADAFKVDLSKVIGFAALWFVLYYGKRDERRGHGSIESHGPEGVTAVSVSFQQVGPNRWASEQGEIERVSENEWYVVPFVGPQANQKQGPFPHHTKAFMSLMVMTEGYRNEPH